LGKSMKNITKMFKEINELPSLEEYIILFDEIDAVALDRINQNDSREMGRVTSTFLRQFDNLNPDVVLIATTNLFKYLDKALARRFDATVDFDRYTENDKIEVAKFLLKEYMKQYKGLRKNMNFFEKILRYSDVPAPGDLRNLIKVSLAFSDPDDPYDYFRQLYIRLYGEIPAVNAYDFTQREFSILHKKQKEGQA